MPTVDQNQIQVRINRLQSQKTALENKLKLSVKSDRKARTRTLIQIGGLVNMLGLTSICGISDGDDLQLDLEASDKAAILLGMLAHLEDSLPPTLSFNQLESFKQIGVKKLKAHETVKHRRTI